jgi:cell division protein FtsB
VRGFESHAVQALRELRAEKDAQIAQRDATIAVLEQRVKDLETQTMARLAALENRLNATSVTANSPR